MKVLIMAQGQQTRLAGHIGVPKQWLDLVHHVAEGDTVTVGRDALLRKSATGSGLELAEPILARTLRQLFTLGVRSATVIATDTLHNLLRPRMENEDGAPLPSAILTLAGPGNNVLAGLRQVLTFESYQMPLCVLLGDVVYSWDTLRVLLRQARPANLRDKYWPPVLFAGTPEVTANAGEIWGVSWDIDGLDIVMNLLKAIKDPPFPDDYQCGQLRKLLWELQKMEVLPVENVPDPFRAHATGRWYHPTTDYTADIDTPRDLARLPFLGQAAYLDDEHERQARS